MPLVRAGPACVGERLALVGDVLVPAGLILTVVTAVGTVHWLKGKRWVALLAPLSIVSVVGIIGVARVAKPDSPWARWRYGPDRMAQACARFGTAAPEPVQHPQPSNAGFVLVLAGVVAGVPCGAVTSLAGGVLLGNAWLARAGRAASGRACGWLAAVTVAGQVVLVALTLPDPAALPGAATTALVAAGAVALRVALPVGAGR